MNVRHPDRNAFERFSRGESATAEERWIEDHLRSGCAACQREVDELLLRAFAPASPELEGQDQAWDRLFSGLGARLSRAAAERTEAPARFAELLTRPWEEWPVLFRLDRRLQTIAVCELLIEKSFEEGFRDASRAIELADRGLLLAGLLESDRYGHAVVRDLQARAWAYLGNARRIALDFAGAAAAFACAERLAEAGSADPLEEARILDLRASLLSDQGHFEQAAELLDAVIDIYDDLHEPHRKGRAMISKGRMLGAAGWHEEAIRQIRKGLGLIDWELEPRLVLVARHNLAWFLNDGGRADEARRLLERFRGGYGSQPGFFAELPLAWLEGRIAVRRERFEEAAPILHQVRQRFLAEGNGYDASLVTLDLALLYLRQGRTAEVRSLAAEMRDVLLAHDIHRHAQAALAAFQQAAELDSATPGLVEEISSYLVRARKNPELRFAKAVA